MNDEVPQYDWIKINGDENLALDWPIDDNAVIWDIGGYTGGWSFRMAKKHNPIIHFFEPMDWAINKAGVELQDYKVTLHNIALWTHGGEMSIGDFGRDGASLLKPGHKRQHNVFICDIEKAMHRFGPVDVCLMNVEGGEFVLIPYMIGLDLMKHIKYFWVQFHLFVPGTGRKLPAIRKMLSLTHDLLWDCGSTAMAWKRRD